MGTAQQDRLESSNHYDLTDEQYQLFLEDYENSDDVQAKNEVINCLIEALLPDITKSVRYNLRKKGDSVNDSKVNSIINFCIIRLLNDNPFFTENGEESYPCVVDLLKRKIFPMVRGRIIDRFNERFYAHVIRKRRVSDAADNIDADANNNNNSRNNNDNTVRISKTPLYNEKGDLTAEPSLPSHDPIVQIVSDELWTYLRSILNQRNYRLIRLRFFEGLQPREIAVEMYPNLTETELNNQAKVISNQINRLLGKLGGLADFF